MIPAKRLSAEKGGERGTRKEEGQEEGGWFNGLLASKQTLLLIPHLRPTPLRTKRKLLLLLLRCEPPRDVVPLVPIERMIRRALRRTDHSVRSRVVRASRVGASETGVEDRGVGEEGVILCCRSVLGSAYANDKAVRKTHLGYAAILAPKPEPQQ